VGDVIIRCGMGRHAPWVLSPLLVAGTWLAGHLVTYHLAAPGEPGMAGAPEHDYLGMLPLCAATVMLALLAALALVRPALVLGYELATGLAVGHAPRASACPATPAAPAWAAPDLFRPPVLATGHCGRAPPAGA
jgi:hypothetical protein